MTNLKVKSRTKLLFTAFALMGAWVGCSKKNSDSLYTNCKLTIPKDQSQISIGGFPRNPDRISSTGTVHVTVIMVDFPDAIATKTPAQAYAMVSGAAATLNEMSYGRLTYAMTPNLQWSRMSKTSTQYNFSSGQSHRAYIQEAIQLTDAAVDFSNTDLLVVLANPDSEGIGTRGPTLTLAAGSGITADGNEMLNFVTSAHDLNNWGSIWLTHESTHALGLVDLYAYKPESNSAAALLTYTGGFSYMGYNSFESNAPGLTAWERWVLGWIDDSQILCSNPRIDGEINTLITPIGQTGGQKAVVIPISETKVVVVESRRASGIDANIVKTGALVYTVDSSIGSGYGPIEVFPRGSEADPLFTASTRAGGESVDVGGMHIEVTTSDATGDTVKITANKFWIER
jgi:M6 family metalloprotease-like protein